MASCRRVQVSPRPLVLLFVTLLVTTRAADQTTPEDCVCDCTTEAALLSDSVAGTYAKGKGSSSTSMVQDILGDREKRSALVSRPSVTLNGQLHLIFTDYALAT